jgi:glycosyltransferase involved in cell wall biosynthesis
MPRVSFLVPCYNLGHLLAECVMSILGQTYGDFEILILDDCSPDTTPEVACSFEDPRVHHLRNEMNLGHLVNYNQGIRRARGDYIWLISADDCLRRPYVLERYVDILERHPKMGYVFCPTVRLVDGREDGVMDSTVPVPTDCVFPGRAFVRDHLMVSDCVPAPSAMARKECYERISDFPLDLPYSGDWYLWCMFALHYDVGYFVEPMVYRRYHDSNMSHHFWNQAIATYRMNQLAVPARTRDAAEALGYDDVVRSARQALVAEYVAQIIPNREGKAAAPGISLDDFSVSLQQYARHADEITEIRAGVYAGLADYYSDARQLALARRFYLRSLRENPRPKHIWLKYLLSCLGPAGRGLREGVSAARRRLRAARAGRVEEKPLTAEP